MSNLANLLAQTPVFSKLEPRELNNLAQCAIRKTCQKGEFICWQGRVWPKVLYLKSGFLEWSMLSPAGKRQVVFRVNAPNVVWGHSYFDGQPMPASLEATKTSEVYIWSQESIKPIVSRNADAAWEISRQMVAIMRRVRELVYGFAFHPVAGRLANLLLRRYDQEEGEPAPRDLTLDEMAASVGSTRELVSRTLHCFAEEGMLEISRVQFIFTDRSKLEKFIEGN